MLTSIANTSYDECSVRARWVNWMTGIAEPVLTAFADRRLRRDMPVRCVEGCEDDRRKFTHLEAFGRTLCGLAPWLEADLTARDEPTVPVTFPAKRSVTEDGCADLCSNVRTACCSEHELQTHFRQLAREAILSGTDPDSPDFLNFTDGQQPIVDAAFLAHAVLRAPKTLWQELPEQGKTQLIQCFQSMRDRKPCYNNWLLFSAMTETALRMMTGSWDRMRVDYALRQHMLWYAGDGVYGDGPDFQWDYYNSFVIQPMLVDILDAVSGEDAEWAEMQPLVLQRAVRHAAIQERLISPEGTFPPIGRSLAYRFGAFQHLAQMALQHRLPEAVSPAQVRCALDAVITRMMNMPGTLDAQGWLNIGFCGSQPGVGERYISTGSLYLCLTAFLPLGLPASDPFWQDADAEWTQKRFWSGADVGLDKGLH